MLRSRSRGRRRFFIAKGIESGLVRGINVRLLEKGTNVGLLDWVLNDIIFEPSIFLRGVEKIASKFEKF